MSKFVKKSLYEIEYTKRIEKSFTENNKFSVVALVDTVFYNGNNERVL